MYISQKLKESNIAEYLIYRWQVEDLIRANNLDLDKIKATIIASYPLDENQKVELTEWYEHQIEMMRHEGIEQSGHLQINKNIIINLTDLHNKLLESPQFPFYSGAYYKALPFIVELRSKGDQKDNEIETCFDALYGLLLLRLQKKEISEETSKATEIISSFISLLANYYDKDRKGELKIND